MKRNDIRIADFSQIEIFGHHGLFTEDRINRSTIPDGLYVYDIRSAEDGSDSFGTVEVEVNKDRTGSIVLAVPLDFHECDAIVIDGNHNFDCEGDLTLDELIKLGNIA